MLKLETSTRSRRMEGEKNGTEEQGKGTHGPCNKIENEHTEETPDRGIFHNG